MQIHFFQWILLPPPSTECQQKNNHPESPAIFHSRLQPLPPQSSDNNADNDGSPEDLFGGSLPALFPDDAPSFQSKYTRIIAADCLWMRWQHENLARTMQWFLAPGGKVWVVAGFHTVRAVVAAFFETAAQMGLVLECIYERDLVADAEDGGEIRREWKADREGEGPENRTRWCVVAVLVAS